MPADGISLPFTIAETSARPVRKSSSLVEIINTHRPSKRPHFAARPLPPRADIGPGGQSVGQAAQFCLAQQRQIGPLARVNFKPRCAFCGRHFVGVFEARSSCDRGGAGKGLNTLALGRRNGVEGSCRAIGVAVWP
jgi:hypothetical protein